MNQSTRQSLRFFVYGLLVGTPAGVLVAPQALMDREYMRFVAKLVSLDESSNDLRDQFDLKGLLIPRDGLLRGGPPKDGIPALTSPKFVAASEASHLKPDDRVVGVTLNGASRAYPIRLLNYHEIVNDDLGSVPLAVIYCPLCDSASVVDRRIKGATVTFGVSGLLHNSNVLMYDRVSNGLWSQLGMNAISGPHAGTALRHLNEWQVTSFGQWQRDFPDSTVLSFATGHHRDYDHSPYGDYCNNDDLYFPVAYSDDRLPSKSRVIGVRFGDRSIAIPIDVIAASPTGTLAIDLSGEQLLLARDALVDSVRVVRAPAGASVVHTFWFAWVAFNPDTEIYAATASTK